MKYASVMAAAALALSACGGNGDDPSTPTGDDATTPVTETTDEATDESTDDETGAATGGETVELNVGIAYDTGGRGDQSFGTAAAAGLDQAMAEFGFEADEATAAQGEPDTAREDRLLQLIDAGNDIIVAVGFNYAPAVDAVAPDYPDVKFALVDDPFVTGDNIANLVFAEHEGSFLVGAAAALKSSTGNVGFVGGVQTSLIEKFEAGFVAGVKEVNPDIEPQVVYLTQEPDYSGFGNPEAGQTAAAGMFDQGADVVYHAAGGSGAGVFNAAKAANTMAIGVDSDQALTAAPDVQDVIITSMVKRVDVAVYEFLAAAARGEFEAGEHVFDLAADGVGYSTTGGRVDDISAELDELKAKIISGEIEVSPTP
ncbi:MAG: BMP family ABC transporter substrate-binding protein [Actinomycetia bacterium]|nr:BMP family ABC transporter substrate-binding protein [Actinomycetes bacterium]